MLMRRSAKGCFAEIASGHESIKRREDLRPGNIEVSDPRRSSSRLELRSRRKLSRWSRRVENSRSRRRSLSSETQQWLLELVEELGEQKTLLQISILHALLRKSFHEAKIRNSHEIERKLRPASQKICGWPIVWMTYLIFHWFKLERQKLQGYTMITNTESPLFLLDIEWRWI